MRLTLFVFSCLFAASAFSQTPAEQAKKIDAIVKRANGFKSGNIKVINQTFDVAEISIELLEDGKNSKGLASKMPWKGFDFYIEEMDNNPGLSYAMISFDDDAEFLLKEYSSGKLLSENTEKEMILLVKNEDAALLENELETFGICTWPELAKINKMDKSALVNFLTPKLNEVLKTDEGKVKSLNACEMVFSFSNGDIVVLPTKIAGIHPDKDDEDYSTFCYGKRKATIRTNSQNELSEHPDFMLDIDTMAKLRPIEFAVKRLATFCN